MHRLHLRDVKGVTDRTIEFPDSGVVIIEGPNEIGKTTLLEAFDLLLDPRAKASSQAKAVKSLQPVGRDVGPRVEAEFSVGRYRLRFMTQWLRGVATELEILAPGREQLSGDAAQQRLDAILAESLDRPLWEALRFTQAGELGQVALTGSAVLTEALDGASGAHLHASEGAPLLELVEKEFLRYYTPTGRVGGELRAAVTAATTARDAAVHAHGQLVETEGLVARHEQLRERAASLTQQQSSLVAQRDRTRDQDTEVAQIVRAHEESTAALARARKDSVQARDDLTRRERSVLDLEEVAGRIRAAEDAVQHVRTEVETATAATPGLVASRDGARADRDRAREVADLAAADVEHLAAAARITDLTRLQVRCEELRADEETARARLQAAPDLDESTVRGIEIAERDVLRLRTLQEATGARVTLEALGAQQSVVLNGESVLVAGAGEAAHEVPVRGGLRLELPGELRVSVQPEESAAQLASDLGAAQTRLAQLLEASGVPDVEAARAAAGERSAAAEQLRHVRERLSDVLGGRSEPDLVAEVARLREVVDSRGSSRPADYALPVDEATARAVARAAAAAARESEHDLEAAEVALADHERHCAQLRLRVEKSEGINETLAERLTRDRQRLAESRERRSDEALQVAVTEAGAAYAKVEARAAVTGRELEEADVEGVRARFEAAERALSEHVAEVARVHEEQAQVQGQVELVSGEGRQEAYDLAVAEFQRLRRELDRVHRRARAARHLRETLTRHRETAHQAYVRPYREALQRLGRGVYGQTFDVEVAEDLTIAARSLEGTRVPFDQLSGGAKEQLGILSRLAVASLVEAGDGVPVIIDDALGYTDPERLERVGAVLGAPGDGTQVILLTCTPERYGAIEGTTTIRLTA
nr:AAA family ATPase [Ornithinimicrobium sp. F0845]